LGKKIGVMQGRLLPKYQGRYQAFPQGYWQEEFYMARQLGLEAIEFILDYNDYVLNPLMSVQGVDEIRRLMQVTGVKVRSICADYFMEAPLHVADQAEALHSKGVIKTLIINARSLGCTDVVIPCVDQSSFADSSEDQERFIAVMQDLENDLQKTEIRLALETDLQPECFRHLLDRIGSDRVTVNYDIGNSAFLGFDFEEEFAAYGSRITDVHIKDRPRNGGSVVLGTGDADIEGVFRKLRELNFLGPLIMQAFRDDEGVEIFKQQLNQIAPMLKQYFDIDVISQG
jgi:L-ribulose-5-phosphate 3-epimerase